MAASGLESAIVPVTGGASGIGLAICKRLRAEGAVPLLLDVNADQLGRAVREVYPGATDADRFGYAVDVRDSAAVDACFERIRADHGPVTHAVANAGIVRAGTVLEADDAGWQAVLDVNLNGVFHVSRAAGRQMTAAGRGAIVTMGSIAGLFAREGRAAYSASKAAVIQLTRTMALEFGPSGIRVNSVAPGVIETPMQAANTALATERAARTALKRLGKAEEIADVTVFLLSDRAGYVTGQVIVADGGLSIRYS